MTDLRPAIYTGPHKTEIWFHDRFQKWVVRCACNYQSEPIARRADAAQRSQSHKFVNNQPRRKARRP